MEREKCDETGKKPRHPIRTNIRALGHILVDAHMHTMEKKTCYNDKCI